MYMVPTRKWTQNQHQHNLHPINLHHILYQNPTQWLRQDTVEEKEADQEMVKDHNYDHIQERE